MNQLFVRGLTVLDFSFLDTHRGLVGESWIVDIVLQGELDAQGMLFDFSDVKKRIKVAVEHHADHRLIVPAKSPCLSDMTRDGSLLTLAWNSDRGRIEHRSPEDAVTLLDATEVTPSAVMHVLRASVAATLPSNVVDFSITLREEQIEGPYYHYSHGLKKHAGQCQRIAHGHRSRIEIWRDDKRDWAQERDWALRWQDIYVGTREDVVRELDVDGTPYLRFEYTANQGEFALQLPAESVVLIDTDSTVEWIANHIATHCKAMAPDATFTVNAYEGVDKGAIAKK